MDDVSGSPGPLISNIENQQDEASLMEMAANQFCGDKTEIYQPKCVTVLVTYFGRRCSSLDLAIKIECRYSYHMPLGMSRHWISMSSIAGFMLGRHWMVISLFAEQLK